MSPEQQAMTEAARFVDKLNEIILFPLIALLSAIAFLIFLWGCAQYIFKANNDEARKTGLRHITWGIVGLVVMVAAWAILSIATATFGLDDQLNCAKDPTAAGCDDAFSVPENQQSPFIE